MATRPETARKILVYWMDGMIVFLAILFVALLVTAGASGRISIPLAAVAGVCLLGLCALFPFILRAAFDGKPRPTGQLIVSGLLTAVALVLVPDGDPEGWWEMAGGLWLSALAMHVRLRTTLAVGVALVAWLTAYGALVLGQSWQVQLITDSITNFLLVGALLLWLWLWRMIKEACDSRDAKAGLAVSEERLRFARDLHDLLGHSLSVISLKSELAAKLAAKDPGRASAEMAEVRRLAAESLTEVDAAVQGYRMLDLDLELTGVRAALEAAGAQCVIEASTEDLAPATRALLAWVVREGATNILKHSTATRCVITLDQGVLEIRNDGVHADRPDEGGSGLRGLGERMAAVGGSLRAAPTDTGEFLLRAAVPS